MAEREGFEPSIRFWRILTFQASAFDHSATAPPHPDGCITRNTWKAAHVSGAVASGNLAAERGLPLCRRHARLRTLAFSRGDRGHRAPHARCAARPVREPFEGRRPA